MADRLYKEAEPRTQILIQNLNRLELVRPVEGRTKLEVAEEGLQALTNIQGPVAPVGRDHFSFS